ncbi:MAG: hypothetical protein ACPGXK_07075, partial [Phycisphaerae bacterium]
VSGRTIEEGEAFYTVLIEDGESFQRLDYSEGSWEGPPEGAYCFFRTHMPHKEKRKRTLVDDMMLRAFFERLKDETDPVRVQFRFVLALILMRKRLLRYEGMERKEQEFWIMRFAGEDKRHQVVNPSLSEAEIESVSKQLSVIMHADMGEWSDDELDDAAGDTSTSDTSSDAEATDATGVETVAAEADGTAKDELEVDDQQADKQEAGAKEHESHES